MPGHKKQLERYKPQTVTSPKNKLGLFHECYTIEEAYKAWHRGPWTGAGSVPEIEHPIRKPKK